MVCLGNICRSPLAEGIFKYYSPDYYFDSAGTSANHVGEKPDHRSIEVAKKFGIELNHRARQFTVLDFGVFDEILVMDESNFKNVKALANNSGQLMKVKMITDFDQSQRKLNHVPDPYYGGENEFLEVYHQLVNCYQGWIKKQK